MQILYFLGAPNISMLKMPLYFFLCNYICWSNNKNYMFHPGYYPIGCRASIRDLYPHVSF